MQITLEGNAEPVPVQAGDTILTSLLRAGVPFPFSCQSGNCGTCKCELVSGDVLELEHSEHALNPNERAQGIILACRTQVWDDTVIRRIDTDELVLHPSRVMRCRVVALEDLTHDIKGVRLAVESGGPFVFSAGQYAQIEFATGLSRHYSMANMPDEAELAFHISHAPGGRTGAFAATKLKVGDRVKVEGPLGVAYLRDAHVGPVLLVAAGSGLAPVESIARTLVERRYPFPVALYFGVASETDIYHEALMRELGARHPGFGYHIVVSHQLTTERRSGLLHEAIASDIADFTGYMAYVAGPPAMVEPTTAMLQSKAMSRRSIHAEAFYDQV